MLRSTFRDADETFLKRIITYNGHVLPSLLPERPAIPCSFTQ